MAAEEYRCPESGCDQKGAPAQPCPRHPERYFALHTPNPDPDVGRKFSKYVTVRLLGSGGMGKVFYALDTIYNNRVAALKLLTGEVQELENEANALLALESPHIVKVYDVGRQGDRAFLAMAYLEGESLESAALARSDLGRIVRQIGLGLATAHRAGRIHRDLKPANIMLTRQADNSWFATLVDFGLAKQITDRGDTNRVIGSINYMAPEQFARQGLGPATDLYALALITAELLSGVKPYRGQSILKVLGQKSSPEHDAIAAIERLQPIPAAFQVPLRRALAFNPADRPTLTDFLAELDEAFATLAPAPFRPVLTQREIVDTATPLSETEDGFSDLPLERPPVEPSPSEPSPFQINVNPPPDRSLRWTLLVALVVAAAISAGAVLMFPPGSAPPDAALIPPEGGPIGAARPDAAPPDAARTDAARPDAAPPDAARPDASPPDAARPDASPPDAARLAPNSAEGRKRGPEAQPEPSPRRSTRKSNPVVYPPVGAPATSVLSTPPIKKFSPPSTEPAAPRTEPPLPPSFEEPPLPPGFR